MQTGAGAEHGLSGRMIPAARSLWSVRIRRFGRPRLTRTGNYSAVVERDVMDSSGQVIIPRAQRRKWSFAMSRREIAAN